MAPQVAAAVQVAAVRRRARGARARPSTASRGCARILDELELPLDPGPRGPRGDRRGHRPRGARRAGGRVRRPTSRGWRRTSTTSVGHQFNLGSPKQLEQVLFYELDLPRGKRTKTGFSTDAHRARGAARGPPDDPDAARLAAVHEAEVDVRRGAARAARPDDGPPAHDVPAGRGLDRPALVERPEPPEHPHPHRARAAHPAAPSWPATPDHVLLAADYSQIELRILAHVSGDVHLREAFERRADIHRETAARVLKQGRPRRSRADERSMAKMVNFGLAYGMSDFGLASRAGIPRAEAQRVHRQLLRRLQRHRLLHAPHQGRRRASRATSRRSSGAGAGSPSSRRATRTLRGAGERMAINMPIQGTAADIMKIALIRLHERLRRRWARRRGCCSRSTTRCSSRCRATPCADLAPVVREVMEGALRLDVPLDVDLKTGDDWESMTPPGREVADAMPELPEVETMARDLAPLLAGATITDAGGTGRRPSAIPTPEEFRAAHRRVARVLGVGRRAKWLVVGAVGRRHPGHPGEDDRAALRAAGGDAARPPRPRASRARRRPGRGRRLTDGPRWLLYRDVRKFGRARPLPAAASRARSSARTTSASCSRTSGPSRSTRPSRCARFRQRLRKRRGRLKTTITDQASSRASATSTRTRRSGARSCIRCARSPRCGRPTSGALYDAIRAVLREAIERRGSSVDDYTAPEGDGEMQEHLDVYQRTGLPCRRCGRPIRRLVLGQRGTHFCSWCQRLPGGRPRTGTNARLAGEPARERRPHQARARARDLDASSEGLEPESPDRPRRRPTPLPRGRVGH